MKLFRTGLALLACVLLLGACQQDDHADDDNNDETGTEAEATSAEETDGSDESDDEEDETPPVPVETGSPVRSDIFATYTGTAPIEAYAEADVVAKVDGEVRELHAEEGDMVAKNQPLASLDGDRLRLELSESRARLQKLKSDFERNKELQEKGLISEGDFDQIQYDLEALQASYNLARLELDYTQIRATIGGVVSERYVKLGNTIKVGDAVFRVTSLDPLVAYMHIPEREFRRIKGGQPVQITIDAMPDEMVDANVTRVSPIVDPVTGTFKITIEISDPERHIKPGMFGRMNIVYDVHENALLIPRSAIIERVGEFSIFVVEDGVGLRKNISIGFSSDGMVEITEGLNDGETVITVGHVGLKNESKVVVINAEAGDSE